MTETRICLSTLPKTWIVDIDGVVAQHNSYLDGPGKLLCGARDFWSRIGDDDFVIIVTARAESYREETLRFFDRHGLRFDHAIFSLPTGERILINDRKPSGLATAVAVNLPRDRGLSGVTFYVDTSL